MEIIGKVVEIEKQGAEIYFLITLIGSKKSEEVIVNTKDSQFIMFLMTALTHNLEVVVGYNKAYFNILSVSIKHKK